MSGEYHLAVLETDLGGIGVLGHCGRLNRVTIGHATPQDVLQAVLDQEELTLGDVEIADWCPEVADLLTRFVAGEPVDLSGIELSWPQKLTPFRQRVIKAARRIPWGETVSYGELAQRSGSPRAARAVGSVMATNRFALVVPCHRVVASSGAIGGFSTPRGIDLKKQLLANEATVPGIMDSLVATRKA